MSPKTGAIVQRRALAADSTASWFQDYAGSAANGLLSFCKAHAIVKELKNAVGLAEKCFQESTVRLEEDIDPETDDRQVLIFLTIRNKPRQEVLAAYRDFRRKLIKMLPRSKATFIRLTYDIS